MIIADHVKMEMRIQKYYILQSTDFAIPNIWMHTSPEWVILTSLLQNVHFVPHMKVSGQFASNKTAKYHAMVMTYLATCKKTESSVFMLKPYTVEYLNLVELMDYKEMYHPSSAQQVPSEFNTTPPDQ